jgi:prepilin-type N-terminal cleavage/methylation domain-containing protein
MKLPSPINNKGFTLVELMVVIGILGIVSGIMIPSFSNYTKNQSLKQAQENFKSDLRSIQSRALTGTGSDLMINSKPALYWGVTYTEGGASYSAVIASSATCSGSDAQSSQTFNLPTNITFDGSSTRCYLFGMEDGSIFNTSSARIGTTAISLRQSTTLKTVTINGAGLIYSSN